MKQSDDQLKPVFDKGFNWYYNRFISPKRHRLFLSILLLITIVFAWLIIKLALIDINTQRIPFPIYYADSIKSYPRIKKLNGNYRDINKVLAYYLLEEYIKLRETYSREVFEEKNWNAIQTKLKGFSSREIYANYIKTISTNNPQSPYFLYLRSRTRNVQINDIDINKENNQAKINFTVTDTNGRQQLSKKQHFVTVSYFISDAENVKRKQSGFKFLITNYTVDENNA